MDIFDTQQYVWLFQIVLAMFLGAVIGAEREIGSKPAGLRTHMFVAGASCVFILIGPPLIRYYTQQFGLDSVRLDPIRNIQAIVIGIAFLGAGTIIQNQSHHVTGLTTAASMLLSSAIGICVALSEYVLAVGISAVSFIVLRVVGRLGYKMLSKKGSSDGEGI